MGLSHFQRSDTEWKWLQSDMHDAVDKDEDLLANRMQI